MRNKLVAVLLVFVAVAFGVGFLVLREGNKTEKIKVGLLLSLTGVLADYGTGVRDGAMLAISKFNASQHKVKIEAVIKNQESDAEKNRVTTEELAADKSIVGIIGPLSSTDVLVSGKIAQDNKVVLIAPMATNTKISELGDYVFRVCPSDAKQGINLARFVVNDLKLKRVAVLYLEDQTYSEDLGNIFADEVTRSGGQIVTRERCTQETTDFTNQLISVKESKAELIFAPIYTKQGALVAQERETLGMGEVKILGADGFSGEEFFRFAGQASEGVMATSFFDAESSDERVKAFVSDFRKNYSETYTLPYVALGYDAAYVLANAIFSASGTTREEIRNSVAATKDFPGVTGDITFDENGDPIEPKIIKLKAENMKWKIFKEK
jgi:branched-chain amino acid transport system substrate-binding protein